MSLRLAPIVLAAGLATWSPPRGTSAPAQTRGEPARQEHWEVSARNPVIGMYHPPSGLRSEKGPIIWNDPCVLKEGDGFTMWASAGHGGPKGVVIYKLHSRDGETWDVENGGRPVLEPGDRKDFDSLGVETPVVVKAGDTYHMYYSAYPHGKVPLVTMGHATSSDGTRWRRLGELESITRPVGQNKGNPWGRLGRGEPAAVYHQGTFYLFFTDVRCRQENCKGSPAVTRGISLATSRDGHTFEQRTTEPIVLPSDSYAPGRGWEGYSTPWVLVNDGRFEMFCDAFRAISRQSIQTSLLHLRSDDGVHFAEAAADILTAGREPWTDISIRSPSVVVSDGVWRMWFAGDNYDPERNRPSRGRIDAGIGLAILRR